MQDKRGKVVLNWQDKFQACQLNPVLRQGLSSKPKALMMPTMAPNLPNFLSTPFSNFILNCPIHGCLLYLQHACLIVMPP